MQPIAAGYNLNKEKFPRVQDWMERVKKKHNLISIKHI